MRETALKTTAGAGVRVALYVHFLKRSMFLRTVNWMAVANIIHHAQNFIWSGHGILLNWCVMIVWQFASLQFQRIWNCRSFCYADTC
jgi:hypothetical protein